MRTTATLSAKLMRIGAALLVVALVSIGLTLWVTWRLSGGAAALNEAGRMRMQTWRLVSAVQAREGEVPALVREFDGSIRLLRQGDATRPLFVPWDPQVRARYAEVEAAWAGHRALLAERGDVAPDRLVRSAESFLVVIDRFVLAIEQQLASLTAVLNMFQFVMMALAIGGAVIMLYTGYHYVIHPLGQLRDALRRLESAEFSARVEVASNDEFGQVAQGFNRMAATLQSLYGDLEGQVAAKTQRIAAQKERLEALYRVSAFLSQAGTLHELTQGFAAQVRELLKADAVALRWAGDDPSKFLVLGSDQFPLDMKEDEKCLRAGVCACGNARTEGRTRVIPIRNSEAAPLQHCTRIGFETLVSVPVRLQSKVLGEIDLFYRREVRLAVEEMELVDALASHLASAVEGMRVAALEREATISGERALLARGLHDSIAQSLAFLKIQVGLLKGAMARGDAAKTASALDELDQGIKESMADVRELLVHFRTRAQGDDIEAAVQETLQKFHQQTGLEVQRVVRGDGLPLAQDVQIQVLHVLQEALSNVRKHAQARRVTIEIHKGDRWRFVVADDGRGFDAAAERTQMHVGLKIMQERAAHIGATVAIDSRPGEGTRVSLAVPSTPLPGSATAAMPAAAEISPTT
ncbi:type IV pili methyl-accepting chemotaxis transducer N-terminal domain-containing protein [Ramlibacter sp. MAHUQ-53]|uniref:type IV pili methyl-accepting chemotaxis transducer N-terminal domain-containing protein n=1 Tax=unclassified Ramlibacter TaxID=2617605 RepID=UPI0036340DE8